MNAHTNSWTQPVVTDRTLDHRVSIYPCPCKRRPASFDCSSIRRQSNACSHGPSCLVRPHRLVVLPALQLGVALLAPAQCEIEIITGRMRFILLQLQALKPQELSTRDFNTGRYRHCQHESTCTAILCVGTPSPTSRGWHKSFHTSCNNTL